MPEVVQAKRVKLGRSASRGRVWKAHGPIYDVSPVVSSTAATSTSTSTFIFHQSSISLLVTYLDLTLKWLSHPSLPAKSWSPARNLKLSTHWSSVSSPPNAVEKY